MADDTAGSARRAPRLQNLLRALSRRNYRLFFIGQLISVIGTWMQSMALSWLIYRITHSEMWLGVAAFVNLSPSLFVGPFAGLLIDRYNKHRLVIVCQALMMVQAFILAGLTLAGQVTITHILVLGGLLGIINALEIPARQSFLVEMVEDKSVLPNAIALNSLLFNSARLIGPAVAGVVIATLGEGLCFLSNAISYIAVIGALLAMRLPHREWVRPSGRAWEGIKEGFRYTWGFAPIRTLMLLAALISFAAQPYNTLMPVFAKTVLHGNAGTLGLLMSAVGIGAMGGALMLASRETVLGLGGLIARAVMLLGTALMAFAFSTSLPLSCLVLAFAGFGMMAHMASTNTVLQTITDDEMRGRVMATYIMAIRGTMPLGNLLAGWLAARMGAPGAVALGAAACLIGGGLFALRLPLLRPMVRPIYLRLGILTEEAVVPQPVGD